MFPVPPAPGGYNGYGVVDAADYLVWCKGGPLQNEGRTTGIVDQQDYNFWRARFAPRLSTGSGAVVQGSTAVPESAAGPVLIILAVTTSLASCRLCDERRLGVTVHRYVVVGYVSHNWADGLHKSQNPWAHDAFPREEELTARSPRNPTSYRNTGYGADKLIGPVEKVQFAG